MRGQGHAFRGTVPVRQATGAAGEHEPRPGDVQRTAEKTGAGNIIMVFGETDVTLTRQADDRYIAKVFTVENLSSYRVVGTENAKKPIICYHLLSSASSSSMFPTIN
jgi:hypothetical protein